MTLLASLRTPQHEAVLNYYEFLQSSLNMSTEAIHKSYSFAVLLTSKINWPYENLFAQKKTSQTDLYLVSLSSKTYVFEDKLTKQ